jgi:Glucose / Sorbosone dehydrogenase
VEALTGLTGSQWAIVGGALLAVILVLSAARKPPLGVSRLYGRVALLLAGLALLMFLALRHSTETRDAFGAIPDRFAAVAIAAGVLFVTVAVTDFVMRVAPASARLPLRSRRTSWLPTLVLALSLAFVVAATVAVVEKLPTPEVGVTAPGNVRVLATFTLPGHPTDIVFRGSYDGYVALAEGEIQHFELPRSPTGELMLNPVARLPGEPRGLAIIGAHLFVSELGSLPCARGSLRCKWTDLPGLSPHAAEIRILKSAEGRIIRFEIAPDGGLRSESTIVSNLPVVSTEHAVNGMTAGRDGRLYVAIGNVDALYDDPTAVNKIGLTRPDLLGTVVTITPDGDLSVFARGLRNVYDLAFDDNSNLYGADNNGSTLRGWRDEQVLAIRRSANYGYPYEGSFGPHRIQTAWPIWTLHTVGSGGIEWVHGAGLGEGLLIGGEGKLELVTLSKYGNDWLPSDPEAERTLLDLPGYVTSIEPASGKSELLSVYSVTGASSLVQLRIESS